MTAQTPTTTSGLSGLFDTPAVEAGIRSILDELSAAQELITGARPPADESVESYRGYLDRLEKVKGRPALYPYVGSGLGNGPLVQLADGSVKWDMINGIGVHMFGHGDRRMVEAALRASLSDVVMQGNLQFNADSIEFAELLLAEAGRSSELAHCFLTNSGAMANESALKIALQKKHARAPRVLAFADCFMGRSTTMAQIGDSAAGRVGLPLNVHVDYVPFWDSADPNCSTLRAKQQLERYARRYPGQHACFVFELVQGEGGFNVAPPEFFRSLMSFCKEQSIAVWADEIQTFGRTEQMFYFEQLGLGEFIDLLTLGKMSQVCACLYTEQFNPKPGLLSGTFIGSTVGLNVGRTALQTLRDGGYYGPDGRIAKLQQAFRNKASAMIDRHPGLFTKPSGYGDALCGGIGGMMRFTPFGGEKAPIMKALHKMFELGVIAFMCGHGPYHIRMLPPVGVMEPKQFDEVFEIVERSLTETAAELG